MRKATGTVILGLVVGVSVALIADRRATSQTANGGVDAPTSVENPTDPFKLTDTGPGAIPFDQLTPDEQNDVMQQAANSETNVSANAAAGLANAAQQQAAEARAEIEARMIGMDGADQEGVVP